MTREPPAPTRPVVLGALGPPSQGATRSASRTEVHTHPDHAWWSDYSTRAVLQLLTESVAEMVGFEAAVLCVLLGDDLVTVGYHGPEAMREFIFQTDPVSVLDPLVDQAETWGRFRFLATEDRQGALPGHWVSLSEHSGHPGQVTTDAWRTEDALVAFLRDDEGRLCGTLSVDSPLSGLRPDHAQRTLLERYAAHAERVVITAFERDALAFHVAHADAARRAVRSASVAAGGSLSEVLDRVHGPLVEGFSADATWIHVLAPDGAGSGALRRSDGPTPPSSAHLHQLAADLAPVLWQQQTVLVRGPGDLTSGLSDLAPPVAEAIDSMLEQAAGTVALVVPLGVGQECVGLLGLARGADRPAWTAVECELLLELGHDLGAALRTAQALERESAIVDELRRTDEYRSQMIATLSHELRTPLTIIRGNVEVLQDLEPGADVTPFHAALERSSRRMEDVVDDLLLLTRVSDPRHPLVRVPVDLAAVVHDVAATLTTAAAAKGLRLDVRAPDRPLLVAGDHVELDRMVANLVSNAVKYSDAGTTVGIELAPHGDDVTLVVADEGLGISAEDQTRIFQTFFRSTNPEAYRRPGTGLGLSIVSSVVTRHGGRVEVDSTLGRGTRFVVVLPRA
ncbi:sensor histidine kinase [Nocardioides plantarum]|uniref:histidine kinase n=1 Tax=Nocardioides plantarum TaxID=29299 RepID=A0ABV5K7H8_9ACTN|nr:GAF domain-containing sensor histidine kinase [Nocardioides plantarum]